MFIFIIIFILQVFSITVYLTTVYLHKMIYNILVFVAEEHIDIKKIEIHTWNMNAVEIHLYLALIVHIVVEEKVILNHI